MGGVCHPQQVEPLYSVHVHALMLLFAPLLLLSVLLFTGAFGRVYKGILTLPGVYTENKLTLKTLVAVKTVKSELSRVLKVAIMFH